MLCADTLEHVDDEEGTIREITRVLKPGGLLVLTTPHKFLDFLDPQYPEHRHYSLQQLTEMTPAAAHGDDSWLQGREGSSIRGWWHVLVRLLLRFARGSTLRRWARQLTSLNEDVDCAVNFGFGFTIAVAARNMKSR